VVAHRNIFLDGVEKNGFPAPPVSLSATKSLRRLLFSIGKPPVPLEAISSEEAKKPPHARKGELRPKY